MRSLTQLPRPWSAISLVLAASTLCSCSPITEVTEEDYTAALAGLEQHAAVDSAGVPLPSQAGNGPGLVKGTVVAPSPPGAGGDSLATARRIVDALVVAYHVVGLDPLTLGEPVASLSTGSDGQFETPVLPRGVYVVTVVPQGQDATTLHAQWIRLYVNEATSGFPLWVVLAAR